MSGSDKPNRYERADGPRDDHLSEDVELILREIEKEPIPEKLLELAEELQRALMRRQPAGKDSGNGH